MAGRQRGSADVDPQRRKRVLRRYGVRLVTGVACMIAFIPLTLLFIPLGALAWLAGMMSLGLAVRGLMWDDVHLGGPPMSLRNRERTGLEILTLVLALLLGLGTILGLAGLAGASDWAKGRLMAQIRQVSGA